jgi:hypothetical protein
MPLASLPTITPPGGAAVTSQASAGAGGPSPFAIQPIPAGSFDPQASDNVVKRFLAAPDIEVLDARLRLVGGEHTANLASSESVSASGGQAIIDLGGLRPITRVNFTQASANADSKLMIQVGGSWFLPATVGSVNFNDYSPNARFPELITEKALVNNAASVIDVESITLPTNVTLRLGDGGVPFFFQRGGLRPTGVPVPDFAQQLDLAIRSTDPTNGVCQIDVVAHSDAFGTLVASNTSVTFRTLRNSLDELDFAARTRSLPSTFDLPVPGGLTVPADRPPVAAVSLAAVAIGFGPSFAPALPRRGAVVSAEFQVAQAADMDTDLVLDGLYIYVQPRGSGALTLELRLDADGEPRGAILASSSPALDQLPGDAFTWLEIALDTPLPVSGGTRLWIVARADGAGVEWAGDDVVGPPALVSVDRGNSWQAHPLTASYAFRRALPTPLVLGLQVGNELQPVSLDADELPLTLDTAAPLLRGLNAMLTAGRDAGAPLPASVSIALSSDPVLPLQVTFTQFDATFVQTFAEGD